MSEALINWFMVTLGGKVGKEFILFLISMVPILELRGGLLAAGPADRKSTRLNSSHSDRSRMPSSA